jgi:hypothetical protein
VGRRLIGLALVVASFPTYLLLVSNTQLYRTQFPSSARGAAVFAGVALDVAFTYGVLYSA